MPTLTKQTYKSVPIHRTGRIFDNPILNRTQLLIWYMIIPTPINDTTTVPTPHIAIIPPYWERSLGRRQVICMNCLRDWIKCVENLERLGFRADVVVSSCKVDQSGTWICNSANTLPPCVLELCRRDLLPSILLNAVLPRRIGPVNMKT
jgi:hypothetical protein